MSANDPRLLRLHPADNVLTVIRPLEVGARFVVDGVETTAAKSLPLGHKVAAHAIATGEKIMKYGAPIGSASCDIAAGEHVHTHNLKSDYLPTFARGEGKHYEAAPAH